jgi:hypothetical protein
MFALLACLEAGKLFKGPRCTRSPYWQNKRAPSDAAKANSTASHATPPAVRHREITLGWKTLALGFANVASDL